MADGVTVILGRVQKVQAMRSYLNTLFLHLYKNPRGTPVLTDTISDYSECTFAGYAPVALVAWGTAYTNAIFQGQIDETLRIFTRTTTGSPETVYGYYITDASGNLVMVQEGNPLGTVLTNAGDGYAVLPRCALGTLVYPP